MQTSSYSCASDSRLSHSGFPLSSTLPASSLEACLRSGFPHRLWPLWMPRFWWRWLRPLAGSRAWSWDHVMSCHELQLCWSLWYSSAWWGTWKQAPWLWRCHQILHFDSSIGGLRLCWRLAWVTVSRPKHKSPWQSYLLQGYHTWQVDPASMEKRSPDQYWIPTSCASLLHRCQIRCLNEHRLMHSSLLQITSFALESSRRLSLGHSSALSL